MGLRRRKSGEMAVLKLFGKRGTMRRRRLGGRGNPRQEGIYIQVCMMGWVVLELKLHPAHRGANPRRSNPANADRAMYPTIANFRTRQSHHQTSS
jgi:hypothetical protein